ncbi:aspartate--tRNA ligase [Alicyclobacillus mengziensis]|uniref:Aspartate--tRNA ligase n=1 Tax=Alicyclobacillus mengziensis TaxID=2931921 RepID=A0A9X7W4P9_9BACL|nr:aspartate--tRNA ligase [Alicyclobacillus mengziensis]QSO49928.1 aspartate--tRNA ligase [Alicyclobacillus mengziensis]
MTRTHRTLETKDVRPGTEVVLAGWVSRRRDLGSLIFVDLRDRSGIVQLVFDTAKGTTKTAMELGDELRSEYVLTVQGTVELRDEKSVNPKLETGRVEVVVKELQILNGSKTPPFYIQNDVDVDETVRLRHRYLDLRRPQMQQMLMLRHRVNQSLRSYLNEQEFVEVETPILTKSTPEGARDYLVPSRLQTGSFYALPQSPQLFKQLLMVSGLERYYQFARCFRDEDLRADRQPEFTQLDIEQSFVPLETFQSMMEEMLQRVFQDVLGVEVQRPFLRMSYAEAMDTYGSDKPDLRFGMPIVRLDEAVADTAFRVFKDAIAAGGTVRALVAPGCAGYSRKQVDDLTKFVAPYGLKGLATVAVTEDGIKSSIAKFLTDDEMQRLVSAAGAGTGDLILIAAAEISVVRQALGALRLHLGEDLQLIDENIYKFLWVVDFPLLSYDEEEGRYVAEHHPFTMPKWEDLDKLESDPGSVRAQAYDMVLNGYEIGGGSMRIYQREVQERMFRALGFTMEEARKQFGFLLDAFEYGTPPHGGIAFGLDRLVMIMGHGKSLRDCIAFPKTSSGTDLLMSAPSGVSEAQLDVLHLSLRKGKPVEPLV